MRFNFGKLKQALNTALTVGKVVLPHVQDAVVVATVLNNQSQYKHKGKVNNALQGASVVVAGVSQVAQVVTSIKEGVKR